MNIKYFIIYKFISLPTGNDCLLFYNLYIYKNVWYAHISILFYTSKILQSTGTCP